MHIGSSSELVITSPDAPIDCLITLTPMNIVQAAADLVWSPVLRKFPDLKVALSEGGIGWIPYFLERIDYNYDRHHLWTGQDFGDELPSEVFNQHVLTCFIDDQFGVASREFLDMDNVMWECDYPHSDSTWPTAPEPLWKSLGGCPTTTSTGSPTSTPCGTSATTRSRTSPRRRPPSGRCGQGRGPRRLGACHPHRPDEARHAGRRPGLVPEGAVTTEQAAVDATAFDPDLFVEPETGRNPQDFYKVARPSAPWCPGVFGRYSIMGRSEVEFALQHPEIFSSAMEAVDLGQSVPLIPLQVDPPEHSKYRKLLDPIFAPKRMNLIEPDIARLVNEFIDGFIDDGSCEFTTALAEPLPSSVFLRLLGLPLSELAMFLRMKDGILRPAGNDLEECRPTSG